jgi:hypothetical protein
MGTLGETNDGYRIFVRNISQNAHFLDESGDWRLTMGWISGRQVLTTGSEWKWCSVADGFAV